MVEVRSASLVVFGFLAANNGPLRRLVSLLAFVSEGDFCLFLTRGTRKRQRVYSAEVFATGGSKQHGSV